MGREHPSFRCWSRLLIFNLATSSTPLSILLSEGVVRSSAEQSLASVCLGNLDRVGVPRAAIVEV
jgi:hypothetical protein